MNISPITPSSFGVAADLLDRGFPEVGDRRFWLRVLNRIERWRPQGAAYPSGFFLEIDAAIKGVVLTPSSRRAGIQDRTVVNFSSWYVEPSARAMAPLMLRKLSSAAEVQFTDLTASPAVARMLPTLGFQLMSTQSMVILTALLARRSHAVVSAEQVSDADRQLVQDHLNLGCLVCGLKVDDAVHPLIFLPRTRRKILPSAQLIYAPSRRAVYDNLPAICAFLLKRGRLFAEIDLEPGRIPSVPHFKRPASRFVKGGTDPDKIDFAYSEFVYLEGVV